MKINYLVMQRKACIGTMGSAYATIQSPCAVFCLLEFFLWVELKSFPLDDYKQLTLPGQGGGFGESLIVQRSGEDCVTIEDPDIPYLAEPLHLTCENFLFLLDTWQEVLEKLPEAVKFEYDGRKIGITLALSREEQARMSGGDLCLGNAML